MPNSDKALIETLMRSRIYRDYETAFHDAVGLPLTFTPAETWGLPLHEDRNESPFCRLMAQNNRTCAACLELQAQLNRDSAATATTGTCAVGLSDSAVPVKLGPRLIGYLRTGQVFTRRPTEAEFQLTRETLERWGVPLDTAELRAAYFATRVVTPAQYQAILRLLELFALQLGTVSNQILVAEETEENPQITRAREFIEANLGEDIDLADCARASHMSTFYFCKVFKRATGLTFTDYVSRLRTERAKSLLLDSHARVSEVAFEVGFQSLSQFNRVFRRITGVSPTEFRRDLPTAGGKNVAEAADDEPAAPAPRFSVAGRIARRGKWRHDGAVSLAAG
jgi:AraC-like DNA-binding protein/ligand-binding sensor protein